MTSVGTLLAFVLVSLGVWVMRTHSSGTETAFQDTARAPSPDFVHSLLQCLDRPLVGLDIAPADCVADNWSGYLFRLRTQAQQGPDHERGQGAAGNGRLAFNKK